MPDCFNRSPWDLRISSHLCEIKKGHKFWLESQMVCDIDCVCFSHVLFHMKSIELFIPHLVTHQISNQMLCCKWRTFYLVQLHELYIVL